MGGTQCTYTYKTIVMIQQPTINFLKSLKKNNKKEWFDKNRKAYEAARADFEGFIQSAIDQHSKNDTDLKELEARKCIFRINRDIRFSKDKSPYKNNFGAYINRGGKKSIYAGYYFHCQPGESFTGGGLWQPQAPETKKVRQEIDYTFDEFKKIVGSKKFKSVYGDLSRDEEYSLSTMPKGYERDNPAADYLKLRSWVALRSIKDVDLTSKDLQKITVDAFETLFPLIQFINHALA